MEYKAGLLFFRLVGMSKQARNPEFGKSKEEGAQDTQKQNTANLLGVLQMFWTTILSCHWLLDSFSPPNIGKIQDY